MIDQVRQIMCGLPKIADIAPAVAADADLWEVGMDSLTSVQLLLLLEEHFEVELPDEALTRETFRTIRVMADVFQHQLDQKGSEAS